MGISSYHKINLALAATPEYRAFREMIIARIRRVELQTLSFSPVSNPLDYDLRIIVGCEGMAPIRLWASEGKTGEERIAKISFSLGSLLSFEETVQVASVLWASGRISTYNCNFHMPTRRNSKGKDVEVKGASCVSKEWNRFVFRDIMDQSSRCLDEAVVRVRHQALNAFTSEEGRDRLQDMFNRTAIDEIVQSLKKFRHLPEDVLKTAFQEFVVGNLLDS
jgi:hypothetical protein